MLTIIQIVYPGFDYSTSSIQEGLWLLHKRNNLKYRTNAICGNVEHHIQNTDIEVENIDDLLSEESIDSADCIIFSSAGNMEYIDRCEHFKRIVIDSNFKYTSKIAFIDGCDSDSLLMDPGYFRRYFKREYRIPSCFYYGPYTNLRGLPFAVYQYYLDELEKRKIACARYGEGTQYYEWEVKHRDIDVSFIAFASTAARIDAANTLKRILGKMSIRTHIHVSQDGWPLDKREYENVLYRSKMAISLPGAGIDTLRYWEIPAHGSLLCSTAIANWLIHPEPFEHNRHAVFFNSYEQIPNLILPYLTSVGVWVRMRAAMDHKIHDHSTVSRATQMLDMLTESP